MKKRTLIGFFRYGWIQWIGIILIFDIGVYPSFFVLVMFMFDAPVKGKQITCTLTTQTLKICNGELAMLLIFSSPEPAGSHG